MMEPAAKARVIRAVSSDRQIRFSAVTSSALWDGVRRGHPHLEATACACLVDALTAALLLQARTFFSERLQLLFKTQGRAKAVVADAWPGGDIRGVIDLADPSAGGWIEPPGLLQVMRSNPAGQPYIGHLELVHGSVKAQVEAYLQQSEQVQASCTLWCDPATGEAGGLLLEPLPACPPERLRRLLEAIDGLDVVPLWERDPEFLARWFNQGDGAEILATTEVRYFCRCTEEGLLDTLAAFPEDRLNELFPGGESAEVRCDYCGNTYRVDPGRIAARRGAANA